MSRTLAGLLREFNVEVVDNSRNWCRGARQTCAGRTLARIFDLRGYEHLRSVIISICETKNNKRMLVAPVIWAVSDTLQLRPEWFGDRWLRALDRVELAALYERSKVIRKIVKPRFSMATKLHDLMESEVTEASAQTSLI